MTPGSHESPRFRSYDGRTALVVVDVQNDFADPAGSLSVEGGGEVVPVANRETARATEGGAVVVFTQDWHPADTPHFEKDGGTWPVHCVRDTWGAEFHPELVVRGEIVKKGVGGEDGYSGFTVRDPTTGAESSTGLAEMLREEGVERVVILGLATDYCVKETAIDAAARGFDATVLREGIRAVEMHSGDAEQALAEMEAAGVHLA